MTITRRSLLAGAALAPLIGLKETSKMAPTTAPALFISAHPDDETLMAGVTIAEHLAAGQEVHVLFLTAGGASGVINMLNATGAPSAWWGTAHNPAAEDYSTLSVIDFENARLTEARTAVRCLAAGQSGSLTVHLGGLQDGAVTQADAQAKIVALADAVAPDGGLVRVKTHTWLVDNHPDHLAAGAAAKALALTTRFADTRYYIEAPYWSDSRLSQVTTSWDTPGSSDISARARNACRAYGAWAPPRTFAIGYHSVSGEFGTISGSPKCLFHS